MKKILLATLALLNMSGYAQTDSTKNGLKISGYVETYYAFDFSNPADHNRPAFVYSFNRHNEVTLNLGLLKAGYENQHVRANMALMTGTYANANLAAEPGVLKNIAEANAGVKIFKKNNLWIDAGVFSSHIGFESAVGKDCWNLTRSILADNSPYFESGAKITFTSTDGKWFVCGLILNGWQRIQRVVGNNTPAFGHQLTFRPNAKITLNSSSFVGSDTPDETRRMRYFHNFFGQVQLHKKLGLILGFDNGVQQKSKGADQYDYWFSPVIIARYTPSDKISITARGEYYSDADGVIITTSSPNGFKTYGYSINLDYKLADNILWRIETRNFKSKDDLFLHNERPGKSNYFVISSFAISF